MNQKVNDIIIIGTGPAGVSAAIYLLRAGYNPLILEKSFPGGKLNTIEKIENYPGYVENTGPDLAINLYKQLQNLNANLVTETVLKIEKIDELYLVRTNNNEYLAKYLVLASGKTSRKFECSNSKDYERNIHYCATCDGSLYMDKDVVIVGGGNSALSSAIYLSNIARNVTIINRSNALRADKEEQEEIKNISNIKVIYNSIVDKIEGDSNIEKVILNSGEEINTSAIFACIGQDIDDGYYQNLNLESTKLGLIVDDKMKTSNDNIYACGDIIDKSLYQIVTAVSEGAIAATSIMKDLRKKK